MAVAMQLALRDAQLPPEAIAYVNAHGTSTDRGDVAESHATAQTFGERMPISSLKSYVGHTLGACGALEAWWTIEMMKRNWYAPTLNLTNVDPACAPLDYIVGAGRAIDADYVMSNNFAFGGINTSLIFRGPCAGEARPPRSTRAGLPRVVVTGMGAMSSPRQWPRAAMLDALRSDRGGLRVDGEFRRARPPCALGGPVDRRRPAEPPRKLRRFFRPTRALCMARRRTRRSRRPGFR